MKIIESFEDKPVAVEEPIDLIALYQELQETHRNVFMIQIEEKVFFYRSLGRAEYKKLQQEEDLSEFEKQDVICEVCLLWPKDFNFETCSAGLPDVLCKKILENSFLDSISARKNVMAYYRNEMFDLDNQITCVINEAFPQFDIEEIEQWDIEKTTKYMSRAEWKLHNLRGIPFVDQSENMESFYEAVNPEPEPQRTAQPVQPTPKEAAPTRDKTLRGGDKNEKMTPEKLAEMKAFQEKFPELNVFGDTILTEGESGMIDSVDVVAPALRPGGR